MNALISATLWNVALFAALLVMQPLVRDVAVGMRYTLSNFDERVDEGVFARRLAMVRSNQIEALVLWIPLIFIAGAAGGLAHPHLDLIATVFLGARVAYAAVSLAGIPLLRSAAWAVGFLATAYLGWIVWGALGAAA